MSNILIKLSWRKLWILSVLISSCLLILGCSDNATPEPTPPPVFNSAQIATIADQVSISVQQTIRDKLTHMRLPLSEDEIRELIENAVSESAPESISRADIQAIVNGAISAVSAEDLIQEDLISAIRDSLAEVCTACLESNRKDGDNRETEAEPDKGRLQTIQERGKLICAVYYQSPGFGFQDEFGNFIGFDIDLCRAVAAAVFGNPDAVEFRETRPEERGPSMQSGEIDMMSRNTTWTTSRDASWGNFAQTMFYDGQGFIVPRSREIISVYDLTDATVCVLAGTLSELRLMDLSDQNRMVIHILTFPDTNSAAEAYLQGQCDSLTTEQSGLLAIAAEFSDPGAHVILPEIISEKPLGPVVPHGDDQWFDIVKSVMAMLIYSEAYGIHSDNVPTTETGNPSLDRLFGLSGDYGQEALNLNAQAAQDVIKQVGNYGQIYDRHFIHLGLVREGSRNALWVGAPCTDCPKGGQIYAVPLR